MIATHAVDGDFVCRLLIRSIPGFESDQRLCRELIVLFSADICIPFHVYDSDSAKNIPIYPCLHSSETDSNDLKAQYRADLQSFMNSPMESILLQQMRISQSD